MSNPPGRKKSLVGANGVLPQIDIPTAPQVTNQLLNKSAANSTSLYQKCSTLRHRLDRIHDFSPYLALVSPISQSECRRSQVTDPVTQLWDCFALGAPLCFLYNLLPISHSSRLDINTDPAEIDPDNMRDRKKAVAAFIMGITALQRNNDWDQGEVFTVMELLSQQRDTNGFVKVIRTVEQVVDRLPEHVFKPEASPPSPPTLPVSAISSVTTASFGLPTADPTASAEIERNQVLRELLETERKYVGDLEVMKEYATALGSSGIIDLDTIHNLFPNLNKLLDFQRQFLILLEGIYEQPWQQQRWGSAFTSKEDEFEVYEPYCANYTNASELLLVEEQNLMALSTMINPRSELPAFLIKPVQRICKYPLLLESLAKRASAADYPYLDELNEGVAAAKRIADKINEAQRRAENEQTVKTLEQRVEDWKGHHLTTFGSLLLDEIFFVTKADVDREYHVFLFEKIILCCKEAGPSPAANTGTLKKNAKTNSLLKKNLTPQERAAAAAAAAGFGANKKRNTPLLLKGRIFLNNVTAATPSRKDGAHSLQVWWRGDDDLEYFTLRCRTEEQLKQWETAITKLIKDASARRASERPSLPPLTAPNPQGSFPSPPSSVPQHPYYHQQSRSRYASTASGYNDYPQSAPAQPGVLGNVPYAAEDDEGDEGYEIVYGSQSGRATPSGSYNPRKVPNSHLSMPAHPHGTKAKPLPINTRGPLTRGMSAGSDGSFGPGVNQHPPPPAASARPNLRSQFSSTRLRTAYDAGESGGRATPTSQHHHQQQPSLSNSQHLRLRSQSTPTAYAPNGKPAGAPPIPMAGVNTWSNSSKSSLSGTTLVSDKRGSGSSQSTNDSSDYSHSQATSPITPYGSNDSSLHTVRPAKSQGFGGAYGPPDTVKVKVHYKEDIFMMHIDRSLEYMELMERVGKKIRLCGGRTDIKPFRVRYKDEDGDMICLASNDDLQIALDSPGVTLYVV